jgi:TPR repeat protein
MGMCYANGTGVAQDDAEAVRWYRLAADQGDAKAQYNIGGCYSKGTGVVQDDAEALRWFRLAADQGLAEAQTLVEWLEAGIY